MNIILLVDSLHSIAAGSERQIYKLAEGLVAAKHNLRLVLLRHTYFSRSEIRFPCPIECLDIYSIASVNSVKKMLQLRKKIINNKVDVVHAYFPDACLLAPLFLKTTKNRIVTSRRDMGLIYNGKPAWLYKSLRGRTDVVISNSSAVATLIKEKESLTDTQSCVIYNGIEEFTKPPAGNDSIFKSNGSLKLILVANIKPVKRTLDAVKALQQLVAQGHNIELALAGEKQDKDYVNEIETFINENELVNKVHLLGSINEPRRLLPQADIGLLVSESEGLSNTIMEYMQAGLPVVATAVGGNPELVRHEDNGLLIDKGNVDLLVKNILALAQDEELRRKLGESGKRRIANEFSVDAMIKNHEAVYQLTHKVSQ